MTGKRGSDSQGAPKARRGVSTGAASRRSSGQVQSGRGARGGRGAAGAGGAGRGAATGTPRGSEPPASSQPVPLPARGRAASTEVARQAYQGRRTQRASEPAARGWDRADRRPVVPPAPGAAARDHGEDDRENAAASAGGMRLQRVLAGAGVGSRRHCEELIAEGRVSVDGRTVSRQGMRVDPEAAMIRVDGERIATRADSHYVVLNKPRGFLTTLSDDRGRPCVGDLLEGRTTRLFHVGRLDAESEGLLLLTNDGELAHRLMHPKYRVPKTYLAEVHGPVRRPAILALRRGVVLDDEVVEVDELTVTGDLGDRVLVEITIHEGRKHVVRRILEEVGHPVLRLVRLSLGPVQLGGLKPGRTRVLGTHEVSKLYSLVDKDF